MRYALLLLTFAACATPQPVATTDGAPPAAATAAAPVTPGLDEQSLDVKADPCTDFFQYACGGWLASNEIPADKALYSRGFMAINDRNEALMRTILEEAQAGKLPDGAAFKDKLADFYGSCMNEAVFEGGLKDLRAWLTANVQLKTPKDVARTIGRFHKAGLAPIFDIGSTQDFKNSNEMIGALDQAGLGLPDRDYYTKDDEKMKHVRELYAAYVKDMMVLAGAKEADAVKDSQAVIALETRLAKAQQTKVERRDPVNVYHRVERAGLKKDAGSFDWDAYLDAAGAGSVNAISVNSVEYFKEVAKVLKETKAPVLAKYLEWVLMRSAVQALPRKVQERAFAFASAAFTGAKEDLPRWKKCVEYTNRGLGEALGQEFVRRAFGEDGKKRTKDMVDRVLASFEANLETLAWMDAPTKDAARLKARKMVGNNKIGYPDVWRDYTSLVTTKDSFFKNKLEAGRYATEREIKKVGKPVDRTEWQMTPPTVNAYNDGQKNEIVFPAGILQPPFFNREAAEPVNFGAMGMVVGHEITHGFDDEGRKFDLDGNLKDWWSEASGKDFEKRAACVKKQFDDYIAIDDIHVKGDLTLGENVADLGGLKLSFAAMKAWLAQHPEARTGSRFTPEQQFFLGFAQSWCTKVRPEQARMRAATDPHSPPFLRVIGPLGNLKSFAEAFSCKETAKMVRPAADRCEVW